MEIFFVSLMTFFSFFGVFVSFLVPGNPEVFDPMGFSSRTVWSEDFLGTPTKDHLCLSGVNSSNKNIHRVFLINRNTRKFLKSY